MPQIIFGSGETNVEKLIVEFGFDADNKINFPADGKVNLYPFFSSMDVDNNVTFCLDTFVREFRGSLDLTEAENNLITSFCNDIKTIYSLQKRTDVTFEKVETIRVKTI